MIGGDKKTVLLFLGLGLENSPYYNVSLIVGALY